MNWQEIKNEYVNTHASYRDLCRKHGVSIALVAKRGKEEGWPYLRKCKEENGQAPPPFSQEELRRKRQLQHAADRLVLLLEQKIALLLAEQTDTQSFRQLTSCLKDLKDILDVKSEADLRLQEARIENLVRKNVEPSAQENTLHVVFDAGPEEWNG